MPHQRQLIREAVVNLLLGQTSAGPRVVATRILPYRKNELPAISVYTMEDVTDEEASAAASPRELTRKLTVLIEGWVASGDFIDNRMDDLALEVEGEMHADPFLGGAAADSILGRTTPAFRPDGDALMGLITLSYAVTYRTDAPEAPSTLDDFLRVDARHRVEGITDPVQDGHDTFTVQETPP